VYIFTHSLVCSLELDEDDYVEFKVYQYERDGSSVPIQGNASRRFTWANIQKIA
jgi:hypothetical protein